VEEFQAFHEGYVEAIEQARADKADKEAGKRRFSQKSIVSPLKPSFYTDFPTTISLFPSS